MAAETPPASQTVAKPRSWPVKIARGLAWVALGIVGLVAVLLLALQLTLRTNWAQKKIASIADAQLKDLLAGQLSIGQVQVTGALHLCVRDAVLKDPDGVPAASVKLVCASADLLALLHKKIHIQSVSLEQPTMFLTSEVGPDGKKTTSFSRAIALKHPSPPTPSKPFAWSVGVDALSIHDGTFEIRDAPDAAPRLAVHGLQLGDTKARYAQNGAAAKLTLAADFQLAGAEKVQLSLDAQMDGAITGGKLMLRGLEVHLGSSGLKADGNLDLTALSGSLHVHDLVLEPADLDHLLGPLPLAAELRGQADVTSDGRQAKATVNVQTTRGGLINLVADSTIQTPAHWNVQLETEHVDPAFVVRGAPEGSVSLKLALSGVGLPSFNEKGIEGDVRGQLHLGPASLKATGALSADAKFSLQEKAALVQSLDADALAVHVKASGKASLKELGLELQIDATDLHRVAVAIGALQKKPPPALSGSAHLNAHVTGTPKRPDAQLHLRAPKIALGASFEADALALDGRLSGALESPHGELDIGATALTVGGIALGSPKIVADVEWPKAHLQVDAQVGGSLGDMKTQVGTLHLAGDAQIDEDRDGAELTGFDITWPGNELKQEKVTRLHLRPNETVLEPLVLTGKRGSISFETTVKPSPVEKDKPPGPTRIDAQVAVEKLELAGLPAFVLPDGFHLGGSIDLHAQMTGTTSLPDIKGKLELHSVEVQNAKGIDGELTAQLENDRLRAQGNITGIAGTTLALKANIPIETEVPGSTPLEVDFQFGPLDLSKVPDLLQRQAIFLAKPSGTVQLHVTARGTLERPRAEAVIDLKDASWSKFQHLGLHADLLAENEKAKLVAQASLSSTQVLSLDAELPFDLTANLRKPSLFAHALEKPGTLKVRVPGVQLALLAQSGILPPQATGLMTASLDLDGTEANPHLSIASTAKQLSVGAVKNLDLALTFSLAQKLQLDLEAKPGGDARGKLDLSAQVSAAELIAISRKGFTKESINPLLDRPIALELDVDKLILGTSSGQGKQALRVRGELDGKITGSGTPDAPRMDGKLVLRDIEAGVHQLGDAEIFFEADKDGANAHIGLAPPSGKELADRVAETARRNAAISQAKREGKPLPDAGTPEVLVHGDDTPNTRAAKVEARATAPDGGFAADAGTEQLAQQLTPTKESDAQDAKEEQAAKTDAEKKLASTDASIKAATAKPEVAAGGKKALPLKNAPRTPAEEKKAQKQPEMTQRGGGTFLGHVNLSAPLSARVLLDEGFDVIEEGDLEGSVTMRNLDLTFLSGLSPLFRSTGGVLDGEVELHGLLDRPEPKGELHLRNGSFDVVGQGTFDDVSLDATLTEKEVVIDRVYGSLGAGTFSGTVVLDRRDATAADDDDQYQFSGELHAGDAESVRDRVDANGKPLVAKPVPIRQAGEQRGDLQAEVDFFGDDTAGNVTATVKIPSAKMRVASLPDKTLPSLTPNPEIFVFVKGEEPHPSGIDTDEVKRQKAALAASNLRVDVRFELQKLQVSANDFDFPVTSSLHVSWDAQHPDAPTADGAVEVKGGTFTALGRRFSIDEAKITETGGDIADPELEIQARYENAQASVLVLISGTAKDPQIDLSSSPPMDQDAIAFFLATGRLQGQATTQGSGVDLGSAATSVLGAALFGKLRSNMAGILPIDTVDIEAGGGDRPPEAAVGKYIGERIFIGYRQRFSPAPLENENEATVEYELARGLGAAATVGEKNQGVMLTWTHDF